MSDFVENGAIDQQTSSMVSFDVPQQLSQVHRQHHAKNSVSPNRQNTLEVCNTLSSQHVGPHMANVNNDDEGQVVDQNPSPSSVYQKQGSSHMRGANSGHLHRHRNAPRHYGHQHHHLNSRHSNLNHSSHNNSRGDNESNVNHVLLITIINPHYPITCELIHQICSNYGKVNRIVIFKKNGVQAMVEFDNVESAKKARSLLNGCDIYSGCCTLRIEYAKPTRLNVHKNTNDSYDYTNPSLGSHGASDGLDQQHHPSDEANHHNHGYGNDVPLAQLSKTGASSSRREAIGGDANRQAHSGHHLQHHEHHNQSVNQFHSNHPKHQQTNSTSVPIGQPNHHHYGSNSATDSSYNSQEQDVFGVPRNNPGGHSHLAQDSYMGIDPFAQGSNNMQPGSMLPRHENHHHHQHQHHKMNPHQHLAQRSGGPSNQHHRHSHSQHPNSIHSHHHAHHHHSSFPSQNASLVAAPVGMFPQGTVLMVYGLNLERVNCDRLFNLFCLYGNVVRVSRRAPKKS